MSFLPEDEVDYLASKGLHYELKTEQLPNGSVRNGIIFPVFGFEGNLYGSAGPQLVKATSCDLLIVIPKGYSTTKLDSFYTSPRLKRPNGADPNCASGSDTLFGSAWQFWSRHLADTEWRPGIDGLEIYLQYVRSEFLKA